MSGTARGSGAGGRHARRTADAAAAAGLLARVAAFAVRRRWLVIAAWVVAIVGTIGLSSVAGGEFDADYTAP